MVVYITVDVILLYTFIHHKDSIIQRINQHSVVAPPSVYVCVCVFSFSTLCIPTPFLEAHVLLQLTHILWTGHRAEAICVALHPTFFRSSHTELG